MGNSMLISYTENNFPVEYVPTVFDNFTTGTEVDSTMINFALWDTAGQEEYARLRALSYPETDVFLVCFSVTDPDSLDNCRTKWISEVTHHTPEAKIVLVGTKIDLRDDKGCSDPNVITTQMGQSIAKELKAEKYLECSAFTQKNLHNT